MDATFVHYCQGAECFSYAPLLRARRETRYGAAQLISAHYVPRGVISIHGLRHWMTIGIRIVGLRFELVYERDE